MQSTKSLPEIRWIHVSEAMLMATHLFPAYVIFEAKLWAFFAAGDEQSG